MLQVYFLCKFLNHVRCKIVHIENDVTGEICQNCLNFYFRLVKFFDNFTEEGNNTQCKLDKLYKKECSKIVTNNYRSFECGKNHIRKGFFTNSVLRQFGVTLCRGNVDSPIAAFSLSLSKCLLQNVWALCTLRCAALSFAGKV